MHTYTATATNTEILVATILLLVFIIIIKTKRIPRFFYYEKTVEKRIIGRTAEEGTIKKNEYQTVETRTLYFLFVRWFYIENTKTEE